MAGNNPNFYSYQNYYEKMLVKFYNYNFFKKNFKKIGFRVIYENKMFTQLFGRLTKLPMHNFNNKFRVNYSKFLIMKKIMKNILITGHNGFIGSNLVKKIKK